MSCQKKQKTKVMRVPTTLYEKIMALRKKAKKKEELLFMGEFK